MPNCLAYLSGKNSDIIHHLYGQHQGAAILHQIVWDHVTAEYNTSIEQGDPGDPRNDNDPNEDDQSSHKGRHNHPGGEYPGGEGPPRRSPPREGPPEDLDNDDPNEDDEDDDKNDKNGINIPDHLPAYHVVSGQGVRCNYLRGFTPGNIHYRDHMQDRYAQQIDKQVGQPSGPHHQNKG